MTVIVWSLEANRRFLELFDSHPEVQPALRASAGELNRQLRIDPSEVGEARDANRRIAFIDPLVYLLEISTDRKTIMIVDVNLQRKAR